MPPEPSPDLLKRILNKIETEKCLTAKKQTFFFLSLLVISAIAFIPSYQMLKTESTASGLPGFVSLIFSDPEAVLVYWQEFFLSLVESLPVLSITIFLSTILMLLGSIKMAAQNMINVFQPAQPS